MCNAILGNDIKRQLRQLTREKKKQKQKQKKKKKKNKTKTKAN